MRIIKAIIATIIIIIFIEPFCQSQNIQYSNSLRPKVLLKLDSLYPHATGRVIFNDKYVSNSTQEIQINCHCDETKGMIKLVFDTNGNLQSKEVHYYGSLNGLPDTILNYMKKNESSTVKFDKKNMIKYYNNKEEVSYGIIMNYSPNTWSMDQYILKFKSNGELVSKDEVPKEGL